MGNPDRKHVYLLTTWDGLDSNDWTVLGAYSSFSLANKAKERYEAPQTRPDGSTFCWAAEVETWDIDRDEFSRTS